MGSALVEVVIDCADVDRVASFWGDVLGWTVQREDGYRWMSASGTPGKDIALVFVPVPEPKAAKNRVHIDVGPSGCD